MTPLKERIQQARAREAAQAGRPPSDSPSRVPYSSWLEPAQDRAYTRETFLERWLADLETPTELNRTMAEKEKKQTELFHFLPPVTKSNNAESRPWTTGDLVEPPDVVELRGVGDFVSHKPERPLNTTLSISLDEDTPREATAPAKAPASCPSNIKGRL